MKVSLSLLALMVSGMAQAFTLQVGTYTGKADNGDKYLLHVREIPNRESSFIALVVKNKDYRTTAFMMDNFSSGKFGMSRISPLSNYTLGTSSSTPDRVLSTSNETLVISQNGNNNPTELPSNITFKTSSQKSLRWKDLLAGNYGGKKVNVSALDGNDEASITSKLAPLSGDYVLRESRPSLYIALKSILTPIGVKIARNATHFVYFVDEKLAKDKMVIVNGMDGNASVVSDDLF